MVDLPFTIEQFLQVFGEYNSTIWPAQVLAYALGLLTIVLAIWNRPGSDAAISTILSVFWLWMGVVYHIVFFSPINKAAYLFGAFFVVQGILFMFAGSGKQRLEFQLRRDAYEYVGALLMLYAIILYPWIGWLSGHTYPSAPVFGVAPCPTTIFTFGLLLWTVNRVPVWLLIIPALWSVVGFTAAFRLGVYEDIGLPVAGLAGMTMLLYRERRQKQKGILASA